MTINGKKQEKINAGIMAQRDSLLAEIAKLEGKITVHTQTHKNLQQEITAAHETHKGNAEQSQKRVDALDEKMRAVQKKIDEGKQERYLIATQIDAGKKEFAKVQDDIGEAKQALVKAQKATDNEIEEGKEYISTTESARLALHSVLELIADKQKELDAVIELLKTNNDKNEDFLLACDGLKEATIEVNARLRYLHGIYQEFKAPW